jgi:hypothetical protein
MSPTHIADVRGMPRGWRRTEPGSDTEWLKDEALQGFGAGQLRDTFDDDTQDAVPQVAVLHLLPRRRGWCCF